MTPGTKPAAAESDGLLQSKLAAPPLHGALLARPALLARLDAGLERKLTLVAAPAGYGKSTLVAQWLAGRQFPVGWLSLDAGDNDPVRFWRYLLAACRAFAPALGRHGFARLQAPGPPALDEVLYGFLNELAELPRRGVLVLEDYHLVTAPAINAQMAFLVEHLPPTLHVVVLARSEPDLQADGSPGLAGWRVSNELSELTAADLRFTTQEALAFFTQALATTPPAETVMALNERVEGWAAGLRLAVLALEGTAGAEEAERYLAAFDGGQRHVMAYLGGEVLAAQPADVRQFVQTTSLLDRLTPALCDAVLGDPLVTGGGANSAEMLARLERTNLFLIPLGNDGHGAWYRYHGLFAEAMRHAARRQLGVTAVAAVYGRASAWYEAQGLLPDAVEYALQAGQHERTAVLIERIGEPFGFAELHTLRRWAAHLPHAVLVRHPSVCFKYAVAILFTDDRYAPATGAAVEALLDLAEQAWQQAQDGGHLGEVGALRSTVALWQGRQDRAFALARTALALLPDDRPFWRSATLATVARAELLAGHIAQVEPMVLEAYALAQVSQNLHVALISLEMRGEIALAQADLEQGRLHFEHLRERAVGGAEMLDDQAVAWLGLASVAYERNDLVAAEEAALHARDLAAARHFDEGQLNAGLLLARIAQAHGEDGARALRVLAAGVSRLDLLTRLRTWQARLALAASDVETAEAWRTGLASATGSAPATLAGCREQEEATLTLARLELAAGRAGSAIELLAPWAADARQHGRVRSRIELLVLSALAHDALARPADATAALIQALALAQPGALRRTFLDEGQPLLALLRRALPSIGKHAPAAYATTLLQAGASYSQPPAAAAAHALSEPLSPQELRVLRLLAAGVPNQEIAAELVVSINTIKTQVRSIYSKLDVRDRAEAGAVARALGLLQR